MQQFTTMAYGWQAGIAKRHSMNISLATISMRHEKYAKCHTSLLSVYVCVCVSECNVCNMHVPYFMCSKLLWIATMAFPFLSIRVYNALSIHNCTTRKSCAQRLYFFFTVSRHFPYNLLLCLCIFHSFNLAISHSRRLFTGTSSHIIYLPHLFCLCTENSWCVSFKVSALWLKRAFKWRRSHSSHSQSNFRLAWEREIQQRWKTE